MLIDVRHLSKTYELGEVRVDALNDVSLEIEAGAFVAIMGPSGSGKSTFMNILGCLDRPTGGTYLLDGSPVDTLKRNELAAVRNQQIGFVFQNFNLLPGVTALENVKLPLLYRRNEGDGQNDRAVDVLQRVGLGERIYSLPSQLSGGQQQRVAIARAMVNEPQIILADEPTGALDSKTSHEIMEIFRELRLSTGITIIVVTHSDEVAGYADRIIRFRDGCVVADEVRFSSPLIGARA